MSGPFPAGWRRAAAWGALLLVAAGAFALRALPLLGPAGPDRFPLTDPDALYHFRLAQLVAHDWPRVPSFDPYLNFPQGAQVPWPFLPDLLAATAARLVGETDGALRAVCFLAPPLLAAASVLLVFALARGIGLPRWAAVAAGLFSSLVPKQMFYTLGGMWDHHAADSLNLLLFLACALWAWRERGKPLASAGGGGSAAALALVSAAMLLTWLGAVIYPALLLAAGAAAMAGRARDPLLVPFLFRIGGALSVGAGILALATLAAYGPARLAQAALDRPSGFHPAMLLGWGVAAALWGLAAATGIRGAAKRKGFWGGALLLALLAAFLAPAAFRGGWVYLAKGSPAFATIAEFLPSFTVWGVPGGGWSLLAGARLLTWSVLFLPLVLLLLWRDALRGDPALAFPRHLVAAASLAVLLLAVAQARYGVLFALPAGVGAALLVARGAGWAAEKGGKRRAVGALLVALVAVGFQPGVAFARELWRDPEMVVFHPRIGPLLDWMRRKTPSPGDPMDLSRTPEWGVLSSWDLGHHLVAVARRPAMVGNFLDTLPGGVFARALRDFTETDPDRLFASLRSDRIRYLLLCDPLQDVKLGWAMEGRTPTPGEPTPVVLSLWSGMGPAPHFRLVRQDQNPPAPSGSPSNYRLFEVVEGARLTGWAPPGARVTATLGLKVEGKVSADYREIARADAAGRYALVLPYPSGSPSGDTLPTGPWRVEVEGERGSREVGVGEEDVLLGREVKVP